MEIISRLNREHGLTVLVVTHDPDVAAYTDRVVTFRDGAIISDVRTRVAPPARWRPPIASPLTRTPRQDSGVRKPGNSARWP